MFTSCKETVAMANIFGFNNPPYFVSGHWTEVINSPVGHRIDSLPGIKWTVSYWRRRKKKEINVPRFDSKIVIMSIPLRCSVPLRAALLIDINGLTGLHQSVRWSKWICVNFNARQPLSDFQVICREPKGQWEFLYTHLQWQLDEIQSWGFIFNKSILELSR